MSGLTGLLGELHGVWNAGVQTTRGQDLWYILAAVVISTLNHPKHVCQVYSVAEKTIVETTLPEQQQIEKQKMVVRLREGLFKSFPIVGYPKVINALSELNQVIPDTVKLGLPTEPTRIEDSWEDVVEQRRRGRECFDKIYDRHSQRVIDIMQAGHPDLAQTALYHLYGPVLSDPRSLDGKDTSLVVVACLMAQNLPSQLKGHWYGALHQGVTLDELETVQKSVAKLCGFYNVPWCQMPKKTQ
ncbi:AhpD-like protein [Phycomyces blakesleeanus]